MAEHKWLRLRNHAVAPNGEILTEVKETNYVQLDQITAIRVVEWSPQDSTGSAFAKRMSVEFQGCGGINFAQGSSGRQGRGTAYDLVFHRPSRYPQRSGTG